MLVIHGLSGADTVHAATLHGIGKATFIKYQRLDVSHSLNLVLIRPTKSVEARATNFICATYGNKIVYFYDRMQGIGLQGGTQKQEEWCIIIKTLLATTNQLCIHQKCTQRINASCRMEDSNSRVTTKYGPNKVWLEADSAATNSVIRYTVSTPLDVGLLLQVRMHDILCP